MDPAVDRSISEHVLRGHMYRRPGSDQGPEPLQTSSWDDDERADTDAQKTAVWDRMQSVLYSHRQSADDGSGQDQVLSKDFFKKYIHFVKTRIEPVLSDDAREHIATEYAQLRAKASEMNRTLPVTARQLETMIRLSTAVAKLRLSDTVEEQDAIDATDLLQFALYHDTGEQKRDKQSTVTGVGSENQEPDGSSQDENVDDNIQTQTDDSHRGRKRPLSQEDEEERKKRVKTAVQERVQAKFNLNDGETLDISDLGEISLNGEQVSPQLIDDALKELEAENHIMFEEESRKIYKV